MPLTRSLSRLLLRPVCLALCLFLLVAPSIALAEEPLSRWPSGWSKPYTLGSAILTYRHQTVVVREDRLWAATVDTANKALHISLREIDVKNGRVGHEFNFPLTNLLKGFSVASDGTGIVLAWVEREEGVQSRLYVVQVAADGRTTPPRLLWQSESPAENPELAFGEDGKMHIVFTSAAAGMHTVQILSADLTLGTASLVTQVSLPTTQARLPVLAVRDGYIHLAYYRQTLIGAWAIYQKHRVADHALLVETTLGLAPDNFPYPMVLLPATEGRVQLVWQRMTGPQGRVFAGGAVMGTLRNGQWEVPLNLVAPAVRGRIGAVRAALGRQGEVLISWLAEAGRTWQVYAVLRDADGQTVQSGFATLARGNAHGPYPQFAGRLGVISHAVPTAEGRANFYFVQTGAPRHAPWYFRAGLDPHAPVSDAVFKYLTLMIGAVGLAFMGLGALTVSMVVIGLLGRYGVFSPTLIGIYTKFAIQFLILIGLKRPHSLFYYGAQFIPGWGAVISFALAAVVALAVLSVSGMDREDWPALGLAGIIFMASDAFVTLAVLGVGAW